MSFASSGSLGSTPGTSSVSSTRACLRRSSVETSNVRSKNSLVPTPGIASSRTPDPPSISAAKACKPFWTSLSSAISQKLWSCTKTDLHALDTQYWSTSLQKLGLKSWFTVKAATRAPLNPSSRTTFLPSRRYLWQAITDVEQLRIERDAEKKRKKLEDVVIKALLELQTESRAAPLAQGKREQVDTPRRSHKRKAEVETNGNETVAGIGKQIRARKIRVYPNKEQSQKLMQWFGTLRFAYNKLVEKFMHVDQNVSLAALRKELKQYEVAHAWFKEVPGEVRDCAVRDMDKARKAHLAKKKKGATAVKGGAKFKFRSKKDRQQSFDVRARDWERVRGMFAGLFGPALKSAEGPLPKHVDATVRVVRDFHGCFYVCIPMSVEIKGDDHAPNPDAHSTVAMDPGVRTFMTTFDADGLVTEWGKRDIERVYRLCRHADKLLGRIKDKTATKQQRRRRRRAWRKIFVRIRHIVGEMHKKLATWLCNNYRVIIIPSFETKQMVLRGMRKITSTTARKMLTWSHFNFRRRLLARAELNTWTNVIVCEEAYTSKTCGACGNLHRKIGGAKTFRCPFPDCSYVADRDVNGARNILIRFMTNYLGGHYAANVF